MSPLLPSQFLTVFDFKPEHNDVTSLRVFFLQENPTRFPEVIKLNLMIKLHLNNITVHKIEIYEEIPIVDVMTMTET